MNLLMNYELLKNMYKGLGADNFFEAYNNAFPKFHLYTMSQDWIDSNEYCLKFKGRDGDIVVNWI